MHSYIHTYIHTHTESIDAYHNALQHSTSHSQRARILSRLMYIYQLDLQALAAVEAPSVSVSAPASAPASVLGPDLLKARDAYARCREELCHLDRSVSTDCPICCEELEVSTENPIVYEDCMHSFHQACLLRMRGYTPNKRCPTCQTNYT
jgi:hypothetical protein